MKAPKKCTPRRDGEWFKPTMKGYFLQCCDCALIHRINFRIQMDSKDQLFILMQAFRVKKKSRGGT